MNGIQLIDRSSPYGFDGWIGPEPHGADIRNAGVNRDDGYVSQAEDFLRRRAASDDERPFLLVVSLVNPHDIVFWPAWSMWKRSLLDLEGIGEIGAAPSETSILNGEPEALKSYRDAYFGAYGPRAIVEWIYRKAPETYRRFYASLIRRADRQITQVLTTLAETGLEDSTHIVCTSDHGELLGDTVDFIKNGTMPLRKPFGCQWLFQRRGQVLFDVALSPMNFLAMKI